MSEFTFAEVKGVTRLTAAREESAETKAIRASLAQGIALSDAQRDAQGFGKAIEFKMAMSGKVTESRTVKRTNKKTGVTTETQTKGGQDPSLVRVLRLLRSEAERAGRGLSVAPEASGKNWVIKFQTRNRKASRNAS